MAVVAACSSSPDSTSPTSVTAGAGGRGAGSGGSGVYGPGSGGASASGTGGSANGFSTGGASSGSAGSGNPTSTGGTTGSGGGPSAGTGGSTTSGSGGSFQPGTGGATSAGSGGSGTTTGGRTGTASGGSSGGPSGACPANAIFCADFESGTIPTAASFFPEYLRPMQSTYVTIDGSMGFNSAHSAKFAVTIFSQMLGVSTGVPTFWTRVYLRSDVDMSTTTDHATYIEATDGNGDPNMGEHIRVGQHFCQLEINRRSDDKEFLSNGGNYVCMGGIVLAKDTWYCLETFYDGPGKEVRVFVDGTESTALHVTDWGPYTYDMFKFGFENYGNAKRNIWYDDVAIAPQRVGCH